MNRTSVAAILLTFAPVAFAQAKPDFSGTWMFDTAKSEMGRAGAGPGGGGPGGRMGEIAAEARILIKQTPDALVIEQHLGDNAHTITYQLNGAESINTGPRGGEMKSKSHWEGNKLVTEGSQTMTTGRGEMTLQTKEVRSLAPDGAMVVERETTTPRGTRTQKLVFKKTT
jgi:hypothetical protein